MLRRGQLRQKRFLHLFVRLIPEFQKGLPVDLGGYDGRSADRFLACNSAVNTGSGGLELESFQLIFELPQLAQNAGHDTG